MSGVLASIVARKRAEIAQLRAQARSPLVRHAHDLHAALTGPTLALLAEHKRRSPSAGALDTTLTPAERALAYAESGAHAISVLTDAEFFGGSYQHLLEARRALDAAGWRTPLLAKEFVLDPVQIEHAQAHGADAVLLIVRLLTAEQLGALLAHTDRCGLQALVEVHDEDEAELALAQGARVVGVNARDLDTLAMDKARAARVLQRLRADGGRGLRVLHLSGLRSADDVAALAASAVDGALIGEVLMRQPDPRPLLTAMVAAARSAPRWP